MKSRTLWKAHQAHTEPGGSCRRFRGRSIRDALKKAEVSLGTGLYVVGTYHSRPWPALIAGSDTAAFYEVEVMVPDARNLQQDTAEALGRDDLGDVHRAVSRLEETGDDPLRLWDVPPSLMAPYQYLMQAGVKDDYAERIVRHAAACHHARDLVEDASAWQAALDATADGFSVAHRPEFHNGEKRVILIVGPTGAGKTTSIAKMAAHMQLTQETSLGLISCDMFRIAAVEQLDTYARIMNLPFSAADSAQSVADAVSAMQTDWVLIDTPGLSPLDADHMAHLAEITEVLSPDETHLVLPLEAAGRWARLAFEKFQVLNPDRLLVTKTDETDSHGGLVNLAAELRLPFSYIGIGQRVPEDFFAAEPERMARMILG